MTPGRRVRAIAAGDIPGGSVSVDHALVSHETACLLNAGPSPARVPRDTDFASLFESDVPIVVPHTRLDSRHPDIALLSSLAFGAD